ncbi:MAG: hypothetical protein ABSB42_21850 [Tepidisphaeraceae bacterium]
MYQIVEKRRRPPFEKKTDRYREVAAYYMQHSNGGRIVCEFQQPLTELYGAAYYGSDDWGQKHDEYWKRIFAWGGVGDRPPEDTDVYRMLHA